MGLFSMGPDRIPSGRIKGINQAAEALMGQQLPAITEALGPGSDFAQGVIGNTLGLFGGLQDAGQQLQPFVGPGFTGQQIGQLGQDLGQFFNQQLLPGLTQGATGAGGTGLGRLGVAQGQAAGNVADAFSSGVTDILQRDLFRRQGAATEMGQQSLQGALGGIGFAPSLFQVGLAPFQAQFSPLQNFAGLINQTTFPQQTPSQFNQFSSGLNNLTQALGGIQGLFK